MALWTKAGKRTRLQTFKTILIPQQVIYNAASKKALQAHSPLGWNRVSGS